MQEAHDLALVAHAATLRSQVPFLHFFDGFRTSHEIDKVAVLSDDDLRALVRDDVLAFDARAMTPDAPVVRHGPEPGRVLPGPGGGSPFYVATPGSSRRSWTTSVSAPAGTTGWSSTRG